MLALDLSTPSTTPVRRPVTSGCRRRRRSEPRRPTATTTTTDNPGPPNTSPFSGATPENAARLPPPRHEPEPAGPPATVDEHLLLSSGPDVAALVQAVLDDEPDDVRAALAPLADAPSARAAAVAAAGALAARLPALSGLAGAVTFDEAEGDLLHAYADLLTGRAEARRMSIAPGVTREQLVVVAHLAAAAAVGDAASEPTLLVLAGIPPQEQLLAGCVLLAQTCADGSSGAAHVAPEIAELFG